jgi:hypothetical protein
MHTAARARIKRGGKLEPAVVVEPRERLKLHMPASIMKGAAAVAPQERPKLQSTRITRSDDKEPVSRDFQNLRLTHKVAAGVKSATEISGPNKRSRDEKMAGGGPQKRLKLDPARTTTTTITTRSATVKPKPKPEQKRISSMARIRESKLAVPAGKLKSGVIIPAAIPSASTSLSSQKKTSAIARIPAKAQERGNSKPAAPTGKLSSTITAPPINTPEEVEGDIAMHHAPEPTRTPTQPQNLGRGGVPPTSFQIVYAQRCREHFPPGVKGIMGLGYSWMLQNRLEDEEREKKDAVEVVVEKAVEGKQRKWRRAI